MARPHNREGGQRNKLTQAAAESEAETAEHSRSAKIASE